VAFDYLIELSWPKLVELAMCLEVCSDIDAKVALAGVSIARGLVPMIGHSHPHKSVGTGVYQGLDQRGVAGGLEFLQDPG
jgi:hypothetical protein